MERRPDPPSESDPERPDAGGGPGGRVRARLAAALPWLLAGFAAASAAPAWSAGWYADPARAAPLLILQGALLNVSLFAAYLRLRDRAARQESDIAQLRRELRYLRSWGGDEGRLRKTGLIRDLNALGVVPDNLDQSVLASADLSGCDLRGASLREANLRGANLQGARLDDADLWGADLSAANLTLASLPRAVLRGCNLRGAELAKANLEGANLHRAELVNANIEGARLEGANLERARFADGPQGELSSAIHSSVEDWIREKLDERGQYLGGRTSAPERPRRRAGRA